MSVLVTTLRRVLTHADGLFRAGRVPAARRAYEDLLERAQERTDRPMEVVARAMLARCQLRARDLEGARAQLEAAARLLDPEHVASHGRYGSAVARVAVEEGPPAVARERLLDYLRWAEEHEAHHEVLDACRMLGPLCEPGERIDWLQRGVEQVAERGHPDLGRAFNELGSALEQVGRLEEALETYQQALAHQRQERELGRAGVRDVVAAGWAVGAVACRLEEWPLARTELESAEVLAARADDCTDLHGLLLGDLAQVYEAAGDVVEARRLVLRALELARQQELATVWPGRWQALVAHATRLEVY